MAVIIIVAIVISALLFSGYDVMDAKYKESRLYWSRESPVAVMEAKELMSGLALAVKNIGKEKIYVNSLYVKDRIGGIENSTNFSPNIALEPGQERKISAPASIRSNGRYCELGLKFGYESSGLQLEEIGKADLIFQCSPSCSEREEYCVDSSQCCSGVCDASHLCSCAPHGTACTNETICCSDYCGQYGAPGNFACCVQENGSCAHNSDCCLGMECSAEGKCFYPMPNLQADAQVANYTMMYGFAQSIPVRTWNSGSGPSMNVSTTRVTWDGVEVAAFTVPSLFPNQEDIQNVSISCATAGPKQLVVTADSGNNVGESDELDNNATYTITCSCPVCTYSGIGHDFDTPDAGSNAYRSFDINITTANAFLTDLWFDNVLIQDYGPMYLNTFRIVPGVLDSDLIVYDDQPSPTNRGSCNNVPHYGPFIAEQGHLIQNPFSVNVLHLDIMDFCPTAVHVGFSMEMGYNISYVPPENASCACPADPEAAGIINVSDVYFSNTCSAPREFYDTGICPSGVCAWNGDTAPGACTVCSSFPSPCSSNADCCNNLCENYPGLGLRCAYGPVHRNGACDVNYKHPPGASHLCVPDCNSTLPCPAPLDCMASGSPTGGSCVLPCSPPNGLNNPACGSLTTLCSGEGYCKYS